MGNSEQDGGTMIEIFQWFGQAVVYLIIGVVVCALFGGRNALSFGSAWIIPIWPVLLLFFALGGVVFAVEGGLER